MYCRVLAGNHPRNKEPKMRSIPVAVAVLGLSGAASAQTFSSFVAVDSFQNLSVLDLSALSYRVSVGPTPTFTKDGTTYSITDVFGYWALRADMDLTGATSSFNQWSAHQSNAGIGGIVGWKTNPNTGLTPGTSEVFTFDQLDTPNVSGYGFHVRLNGVFPGTSGNTGYVTLVPAPAAAALLGIAGAVAMRRHRTVSPG